MARLDIRRFVAARPQAVWDVLADLEHQASWMVDVRRLEIVTKQKSGAGTVLHVRSALFGLPLLNDVMEITAWDPPRRLAVLHRGQYHGTGEFLLKPAPNGTTFTWIEEIRPPLGALGEAAFALVVRPHLRRVFARSMANVARLAEATQARE